MKLSEVKKIVINEAFAQFKCKGYVKKKGFLVKQGAEFSYYIGFGLVDNDNSFPTTFHYGISSKLLNNILLEIFPEKGYKRDEYIGAYGIKQERLYDNKECPTLEYDIKSEKDVKVMIKEMAIYFKERAFPFLEHLSSYDTLSKVINSEKVISESMHLPTTLINGIVFSRISNSKSYNINKTKYIGLVESWPEWDKLELNKVIKFLDNHTAEELKGFCK